MTQYFMWHCLLITQDQLILVPGYHKNTKAYVDLQGKLNYYTLEGLQRGTIHENETSNTMVSSWPRNKTSRLVQYVTNKNKNLKMFSPIYTSQ